jgi:hypothetical protein
VAEMHPDQWSAYGIGPADLAAVLAELGLRARNLTAGDGLFRQGDHAVLETD